MVKTDSFKTIKFYKILICVALVFFGGAFAFNPQRYTAVCFDGICLWAECVLPSLFPFMVVCLLLTGLGAVNALSAPFKKRCLKIGVNPAALSLFILSAVSGYPAGSRLLCEYFNTGKISSEDIKLLAPLCSVCAPTFALGTVGYKAFSGGYCGVKLLLAAYLSVTITTLFYAALNKNKPRGKYLPAVKKQSGNLLYDSFYGAVSAVLCAGGFICFFYTLSAVIADFKLLAPLTFILRPVLGDACNGLAIGLCEATGGCFAAAAAGGFFALPIAGFLLVFGGASILLQQLCYLMPCGVTPKYFITFKFVQGTVAFFILCLFGLVW